MSGSAKYVKSDPRVDPTQWSGDQPIMQAPCFAQSHSWSHKYVSAVY